MKIALYNVTATTHFGGLETYGWEVGKALVQQGHEVWVVAGEGAPARHPEVHLKTFPFTPRDRFPNLGTRFRKLMERISFGRKAMPWLIAQQFDAIIINKPFDMPAMWLAKRCGCKAVTVFRSGGTDFFKGDRWFAGAVDLWLSTSRYNAAQIEDHFGRTVTLVPNGVDVDKFAKPARARAEIRAQWDIPETVPLMVSVGRLIGWKGLHIVLEALAGVPEAHYLIVGQGEERERLASLASRLGMGERIHFSGAQPHETLPDIFHAADIFVQPSIGEEAFGISVVEAMACALPVLVSRNGGMVEIVQDGVNGHLLPKGDIPAWREALSALTQNPEARQRLGQAARQRVVEYFTWAGNAQRLEALIRGKSSCA